MMKTPFQKILLAAIIVTAAVGLLFASIIHQPEPQEFTGHVYVGPATTDTVVRDGDVQFILASTAAFVPKEVTVSSGNYTLSTPDKAAYIMTYSSSGGKFVFAESAVDPGEILRVCNAGSNTFQIDDTAGLSETAGNLTVGQYDCYDFMYLTDRFAEVGGSNN